MLISDFHTCPAYSLYQQFPPGGWDISCACLTEAWKHPSLRVFCQIKIIYLRCVNLHNHAFHSICHYLATSSATLPVVARSPLLSPPLAPLLWVDSTMPPKKLYRLKNRHYTASIIPLFSSIPPFLSRQGKFSRHIYRFRTSFLSFWTTYLSFQTF